MSNIIPIASEPPKAALAPLDHIKVVLNKVFKGNAWKDWEIETISDSLNITFDELTRDKIQVLQILEKQPDIFLNNVDFFLHATEVINNKVTDFEYVPMPTTLELAYSLYEGQKLTGFKPHTIKPNSDIVDAVSYLLIEDGYSEPIYPFEFIPKERLTPGQTSADTSAKATAINNYINHMESL